MNRNDDQYKVFKQLVHTFYHNETEKNKNIQNKVNNLVIEPRLIYDTFHRTIKAEFRIGDSQLYKIKSLPEFFERMLNNEEYKYGAKLNFVHNKSAFREEDARTIKFYPKICRNYKIFK